MNTITSELKGDTDRREGKVAKAIERQTSKVPSDLFLWGAGAAVVGSAVLQLFQQRGVRRMLGMGRSPAHLSLFVGQWAPTLLLLGIYNKIVKVMGSDVFDRNTR